MAIKFTQYNPLDYQQQIDIPGAYARGRAMQTAFRQNDLKTQQMELQTEAMPEDIRLNQQFRRQQIETGELNQELLQAQIARLPFQEQLDELNLFNQQMQKQLQIEQWTDQQMAGLMSMPEEQAAEAYQGIRQQAAELGITNMPDVFDPNMLVDLYNRNKLQMNDAMNMALTRIDQARNIAGQLRARGDEQGAQMLEREAARMEQELEARRSREGREREWQIERAAIDDARTMVASFALSDEKSTWDDLDTDERQAVRDVIGRAGKRQSSARTIFGAFGPPKEETPTQARKRDEAKTTLRASVQDTMNALRVANWTSTGWTGDVGQFIERAFGPLYEASGFGELRIGDVTDFRRLSAMIKSKTFRQIVGPGPVSAAEWDLIAEAVGEAGSPAEAKEALRNLGAKLNQTYVHSYVGNRDPVEAFKRQAAAGTSDIPHDALQGYIMFNRVTREDAVAMGARDGDWHWLGGNNYFRLKIDGSAEAAPAGGEGPPLPSDGFIRDEPPTPPAGPEIGPAAGRSSREPFAGVKAGFSRLKELEAERNQAYRNRRTQVAGR